MRQSFVVYIAIATAILKVGHSPSSTYDPKATIQWVKQFIRPVQLRVQTGGDGQTRATMPALNARRSTSEPERHTIAARLSLRHGDQGQNAE